MDYRAIGGTALNAAGNIVVGEKRVNVARIQMSSAGVEGNNAVS